MFDRGYCTFSFLVVSNDRRCWGRRRDPRGRQALAKAAGECVLAAGRRWQKQKPEEAKQKCKVRMLLFQGGGRKGTNMRSAVA